MESKMKYKRRGHGKAPHLKRWGALCLCRSIHLIRLILAQISVVPCKLCDDAAECQDCQQVGNDHQAVEHIRHIPYQGDLLEGAHHDEHQSDDTIDKGCLLTALEQSLDVAFTEEIPADDGGEGEEQQADGNKDAAKRAEGIVESSLCQSGGSEQRSRQGRGRAPQR